MNNQNSGDDVINVIYPSIQSSINYHCFSCFAWLSGGWSQWCHQARVRVHQLAIYHNI